MIGVAIAAFLLCCLLPLAYMLSVALSTKTGTASALMLDTRQRGLLWTTTTLGSATALLSTVIGAPLGAALARVDLPRKSTLRVLLAAPMLLPPYVVALAWISLDAPTKGMYSTAGAVLVLTLVFYPVSMLATEAAIRRIEPRLEEAALVVARPHRALWGITLRLAGPSIAGAALVIFVLTLSEFGVPGLLRVRVYTTEVFTAFAALYDFGRATVLALPLLLISTAVTAVAVALLGERLVTTRRGAASGHVPIFRTWKPAVMAAAAVVIVLALVLPLAALIREATAARSWASVVARSGAAIRNSIVLAIGGATLTAAVGLSLGYARARARRWLGTVADLTFVVVFAVPSTVVGVGLIGLYNRPGMLGAVYGTDLMLLLVCLARFLPVAALGMSAVVAQVPRSHEEAAAAAGARWWRTMTDIVVPQTAFGLLVVWVVVFVLAFGELGASILVAPPGEATLPIRIYTLIANAPPAEVAALALLQSAVVLSPLMLLSWGIAARKAP
ncbi:MAG: ABC transporter permease [Vicinamibacteria bacterium]